MAGDWIKMRKNLAHDPSVIYIAAAVGLEEDHIVGKLHRLWSWADENTRDGNVDGVTEKWIDRYVGVTGFAKAMRSAGWLLIGKAGISFPKFDNHMSKSAKKRVVTASRVDAHRKVIAHKSGGNCNAADVTEALPEKRREEKREEREKIPLSSGNGTEVHPRGQNGKQRPFDRLLEQVRTEDHEDG